MVRTKVFVGNLDFQTKESELAQAFSTAGKVISANIITRGPRSLGYGFVEMESEEDAQKAVQAMNKKEIDGRPINVEVAKPREEGQDSENKPTSPRGGFRGRGSRGGFRGSRGGSGTRGGARGGFSARGGAPGGFRGGRGAPRGGSQFKPRSPGGNKPGKEEDNRTPSKTTLFVANLPFKLDDEAFGKILKDATLNFKTAHVVRNTRSQRSKGFGFIEFENEQDQQKALTALNNKTVDERQLVVKVALTELKTEEDKSQTKQ
jgi:RNA recognition motif-containing protein